MAFVSWSGYNGINYLGKDMSSNPRQSYQTKSSSGCGIGEEITTGRNFNNA
jgi:hypothetical protein